MREMVRDYVISDNDVLGNVKKNLIKYEILLLVIVFCYEVMGSNLSFLFVFPFPKLERSLHRYYPL